jgi:hypothetical protein
VDTATDTPTASPTFSVSPTITPSATPTATPAFASSHLNRTVLAPNPVFKGQKLKLYFAERPSSCDVEVFDLAGELIQRIHTGEGEQPLWDCSKLSFGIYILVVETHFDSGHWERFTKKIAIIK